MHNKTKSERCPQTDEQQNTMDLLNQKRHGGQQFMEKDLIEINGQDTFLSNEV